VCSLRQHQKKPAKYSTLSIAQLAKHKLSTRENKLAVSVGSKSSLVDLVQVLSNCSSEFNCVNGAAKAPQVDGILGIDDNAETRAGKRVGPEDGASGFPLNRHCSIKRHG
jgi:hypothetical protein